MFSIFISQQTICMGISLLTFSLLNPDVCSAGLMIVNLVIWGILTSMTEGGCFAVVPYVLPNAVGGVAGIVGAGGNTGALLGNFMIVALKGTGGAKPSRNIAFCAMGWGALSSALLCPLLWLPGIGSMFRAQDVGTTAAVPEQPQVEKQTGHEGPVPTFVPMQAIVMSQPIAMAMSPRF